MANISRHAGTTDDIVERELGDSWVEFQQEGERLPDAACGAEDGDFGGLPPGR